MKEWGFWIAGLQPSVFYLNLLLNFILLRATKEFLLKRLPTHSRMHPIILVGYTVLAETIEPPWGKTLNPKWEMPFTYQSHSHHTRCVQLSAYFGMIKSCYHNIGFLSGLFFLDLWSFHINSHLNLALKYQMGRSSEARAGVFNGKQASRLTVLERWAKALMWSSSSYMISRSSPVLWPGLQTSTEVSERTCHSRVPTCVASEFTAHKWEMSRSNEKRESARGKAAMTDDLLAWRHFVFQMMSQDNRMFTLLGPRMRQYIPRRRGNSK